MHPTEVAPVTQIRPLRPVAAAVQTSSAIKTAELQTRTQFVDRTCASWADRLAAVQLMLIEVRLDLRGRRGGKGGCLSEILLRSAGEMLLPPISR